jgi:hypothetical protein
MVDEVAKLKRRVKDLEGVVELLVEHTGAGEKVAHLEEDRAADRAQRTADRNAAISRASVDASAATRRNR